MIAQWTGKVVGKMHIYRITQTELADALGVSRNYVAKVLNGAYSPKDAETRFMKAVDELIRARS